MRDIATFTALTRFGLGAAPGDEAAVDTAGGPQPWLQAQIARPSQTPAPLAGFRSSADILAGIWRARAEGRDAEREAMRQAYRDDYRPELRARGLYLAQASDSFTERMVLFWSNHFTVSSARRAIGAAIAAYEREAIRPHVFGRFSDMVRAVGRHPVMLVYLDNAGSVGPNSRVGRRRITRTGAESTLNENLAREVLELHTVGVHAGYDQEDVIALAQALSGWSHGGQRRRNEPEAVHGGFEFIPAFHEPGAKTILGVRYDEDGEDEGLRVLDNLARHPATALHLATKLVRHFVADDPPEDDVRRIAAVFTDTGGDLAAVSRAVVELRSAWATPLGKVKSPQDYVISANRAAALDDVPQRDLMQPMGLLGQETFAAPSPQGWGDTARDWLTPEALMTRIEWARRFAATWPAGRNPAEVLDATVGPVASAALHQAVARAPSGDAAIALILVSPEFQRR